MGVLASLKDLVLRVERYLKYQLYHAQNTYPYPEDQNVAEWVRDEGEPNGWTKFTQAEPETERPSAPQAPQIMPPVPPVNQPPTKPVKKKLTI